MRYKIIVDVEDNVDPRQALSALEEVIPTLRDSLKYKRDQLSGITGVNHAAGVTIKLKEVKSDGTESRI